MASSPPHSPLRDFYQAETARIRQRFEATGDGQTAIRERSAVVDGVAAELYRQLVSADLEVPEKVCLVALGGYGRRELFPHSDVDILCLSENSRAEVSHQEALAGISRALWDLPLRLTPTTRTLEECDHLYADNLEFSMSLLDCRYLAGDARLFASLHDQVIPQLVAREGRDLVRNLAELTRRRHAKYGDTVFHLEPNLKEAPGGLRDYQLGDWLSLIFVLEKQRRWAAPEDPWPAALQEECRRAFKFLSAARCFLHYRQGRDENHLTYEFQEEAATAGIGHRLGEAIPAGEWMRTYFLHARSIHRRAAQALDEESAAHSTLYDLFQDWRSRLSNADFTVLRGRIFPRQPAALQDPTVLLGLFEFMARHGLQLSGQAERGVEQALPRVSDVALPDHGLWAHWRRILVLPHAAEALRAMHRLGVLARLFPEFRAIDALVIRDFYHRYTVDEHSFLAIQNLHGLRAPESDWERRFSEIFVALEQPDLLFFSLVFHDVGKGLLPSEHIQGSLQAVEAIFARLDIEPADQETIRFLISNHLLMSATLLRRDIFEPETVRNFAERVGTLERLKMLCLFTYADIKGVNPEALTPWKAEMLWQLFAAATNYLARSVDDERFHAAESELAQVEPIRSLVSGNATAQEVNEFLEGLPKRYMATRSPQEIATHYQMARRLAEASSQVRLRSRAHYCELTVLTADRPFLFASITGALTAWGMNILKAEAFSNQQGIVLDTFCFADPFRTLELNPSEVERLERSLVEVLSGQASLESLMSGRLSPAMRTAAKVKIPTEMRFDDDSSSHSTLLELIAQDRPGLLYQVSSAIAELGCNIEVALIDTEGQKVIDVFYLTCRGAKLDLSHQRRLREALHQRL